MGRRENRAAARSRRKASGGVPSSDALLDLFYESRESWLPAGTPQALGNTREYSFPSDPPPDALDALKESARMRNQAEILVCEDVVRARAAGVSWTDIGLALGVSKQAAHRRFAEASQRHAP